jgi:hypothetical protein
MATSAISCRTLLGLLDEFYEDLADPPPLEAAVVDAEDIPQPQQRLLVHAHDMTSTLQHHFGEPIALRVLDCKLDHDCYLRHIVLETAGTRRPAEYGAIRVHLPSLDEAAQAEVLEGRTPMGKILNGRRLLYRCCPGAFFRLFSNALIDRSLRLEAPEWLYGRCNCLAGPQGRTIAEVIEILPPAAGLAVGAPAGTKQSENVSEDL